MHRAPILLYLHETVHSITFRYHDLPEMRAALGAGGGSRCLVVPEGAQTNEREWVLAVFEFEDDGRATAAAGRVVAAGDDCCLQFERRDWDRLVEFTTPWDLRVTQPGVPPVRVTVSTEPENARALVVEDERASRKMVATFLSGIGLSTRVASSAENALELLEEESFDLIVLDLGLPGMSGLELCRELRGCPETATMPILILTGDSSEQSEREAGQAGANDYVTKPVPVLEFRARVLALLRRGRASNSGP